MIIENLPSVQLPLFSYGEPAENIAEMLPMIWEACEALVSQDATIRQHGIDALLEVGAQRGSTLVAYMIATLVNDPDIYIRRRVVYILADIITKPNDTKQTRDDIRMTVINYLRKMSETSIYGLLEVAVMDPQIENAIYRIFTTCPPAGKYLANIISEWNHPLLIRQKAIQMVGLVGYMEAFPALQRLLDRLEARHEGQYAMAFVPASIRSDEEIIPYLRDAIQQLKSK
jgi:HEAT repeat protein